MQNDLAVSKIADTMTPEERRKEAQPESRTTMIVIVAVGAAVVIALFFFLLMRSTPSKPGVEPTLQGAIRQGSPEWDQNIKNLVLDEPEADQSKRALGDWVMTLQTTVRNLTGKTLNGLEIRAAVVDHQGNPVKQRTVIIVPAKQGELAPNKTLVVPIKLEGMTDSDDRANIKMEITGFKFKE